MVFTGDHQPGVVVVTVEPFNQVRHEASAHLIGECAELRRTRRSLGPTDEELPDVGIPCRPVFESNSDFKEACIYGQLMKLAIRVQREIRASIDSKLLDRKRHEVPLCK